MNYCIKRGYIFQFIRDCIAGAVIPQLMLLKKENVHDALRDTPFHVPSYVQRGNIFSLYDS